MVALELEEKPLGAGRHTGELHMAAVAAAAAVAAGTDQAVDTVAARVGGWDRWDRPRPGRGHGIGSSQPWRQLELKRLVVGSQLFM